MSDFHTLSTVSGSRRDVMSFNRLIVWVLSQSDELGVGTNVLCSQYTIVYSMFALLPKRGKSCAVPFGEWGEGGDMPHNAK